MAQVSISPIHKLLMALPRSIGLGGFTVVLVGDNNVGKSWLIHRYISEGSPINKDIERTVGVEVSFQRVRPDYDTDLRLDVYDTAGRESFDSLSIMYCRVAHAAIVVYDITNQRTFEKAKTWVKRLQEQDSPNIFIALAGNKADCASGREVKYEDARSYADDNNLDLFMEVSAKTAADVRNLFLTVGYNLWMADISAAKLRKTIHKNFLVLDLGMKKLLRVPDTVTELTEVEILHLSHNNLTAIPTSVNRLTNLTMLSLSHNKLTQLPDSVVELINLIRLYVNNNQLSSLPSSMKQLEKLQVLDLRNNKLKRLCIEDISHLKHLSVGGNPLTLEVIRSLMELLAKNPGIINVDTAAVVPTEILAQGPVAKLLYERALKDGSVNVYRGRILLIGQDRAGKTSLKKSFLGLPFDPKEQSTEGIEVDPSKCEIEVEQVKNWNSTGENKPSLSEFYKDISRMLAEKQYHWILSEAKEGSGLEPEEELESADESEVESIMTLETEDKNSYQVSDLKNLDLDVSDVKNTDVSSPASEMQVQAEANNAVNCHTDDGSVSASEESELMIEDLESEEESEVESIVNLQAEDKNSSQVFDLKNTDVSDLKNAGVSSPASEMEVQAGANNAVNCRTDDGSVSTSEESESLMIDATSPPDDVTKHADQLLKCMFLKGLDAENADNKTKSIVTVDLWDFAGQHLYYASHPVFLSSRAVYVLVHNLSKPLNAPAQPCVRQGAHDVILENPNNETNLENLLSWLVTVHSMKPTGEGMVDDSQRMLPYLRPPVFIVGTHADKPFQDPKTMTSTIQQGISGKEYETHVIRPFFSIDNTRSNPSMLDKIKKLFGMHPQRSHQAGQGDDTSGDGIYALRTKIMEVLRQEPYMGETIPVRWFNFEKVVEALVAKNIYQMSLEQLQTYAKEVCLIEDEAQFHTMLNFYHDLGMIVKHRNTVILKAQWLIDLFKMLITIPRFDEVDPIHSKYWQEVETSGVLSMELVDLVFSRFIQQGVIKEDILDMMERFGLIAKFSPSPTDVKYFVPAQLKSSPEDLCKMEPSPTDPCPLYLHFVVDGFVPHGLFSRLVSRSTSWCSDIGSTQPPNLYQNGAWFVIGRQIIHDMILICKKRFIKILLKQRSQDEAVSVSTTAEVARSVRLFVEGTLQDLSQELPYLSGLQYKFCVACPYCLQGSHKCANHSQPSCAQEDCLHLLEMKQGERLLCMKNVKNVCDKVLSVRGLEKWFLQTTSQDLSPCTTTVVGTLQGSAAQGNLGTSDTALRVTLLASEWNSSMGGLSTINRQLAVLLAKHMQVEVTLLVPQFACCEEEKRAARSHNISIREAERRPGYDSLDWLSFPPNDLAIDIVLGHGGKLGKQAQVIRESHSCKWVQVVHTAPEELGMHKNYPRAISKGEEKNRTEVDLCKLANLVVAVGPKLTEAYSSYLRSCKKHQDIIQLTPGTFSEFAVMKQATNESGKFKVLTFGRGDPEDFSLKGYDIAARAIVELRDRSYRLIFVGAPDGKEEEVAENLLQSGISKDQLIVRKFLQSKERLKELFCEVDLAIMPSRTEGFGLTALEALSAGLPILVSGNSGFGDALRALPLGKPFVVECTDPKDWAKEIAAVRLKDRAERLQEIQRLRTCYEEHYSWERQCEALVQKMLSIVHD